MKQKFLLIVTTAVLFMLFLANMPVDAYSITLKDQDHLNLNLISYGDPICYKTGTVSPDWYYKPESYGELVSWYQTLESNYPEYLEVFKANEMYGTGKVAGGYDLYYVRITNESLGFHKPEVLFLGSPHGDETVGTIGLYWFTDWLMRKTFTDEPCHGYSKDWLQWLIDNREIYFEVSHNPYGFDHGPQRYDGHGWDLNREADYDGPGSPTGGTWGSVNGKTLYKFVNNHTIRVGCDFHGGTRMLLYPWAGTYTNLMGTSPLTGYTYANAPPDFYFYDATSLRLGDFMGDYGGDLNKGNIGTVHELINYPVKGGITPWAYAADVEKNEIEDIYVKDEVFGNYPGAGILWISPEMSYVKNPWEHTFGNDTTNLYGAEIRRFVLHQTDIAQPYVRWQPSTIPNDMVVKLGSTLSFEWQVNGSMVVDHTYVQWGTDPNPINNYSYVTIDHDENAGEYIGGTGWDNAKDGETKGVTYSENITIDLPGDYYFVAKSQVDQRYANVFRPDIYGDTSYLRLIKERTNDSYYEVINGTDGTEEIIGQNWWYSSIIHVKVRENEPPVKPNIEGKRIGKTGKEYSYVISTTDPNEDEVFYYLDWGDDQSEEWIGPYESGEIVTVKHSWNEKNTYTIRVKAKDIFGDESDWTTFVIGMPKYKVTHLFIQFFEKMVNRFSSME